MSTSRLRRALLAAAIGVVPLAAGGGAVAIATTPPPIPTVTPTITPTPTPGPTGGPLLCSDPWAPDLSSPYGSPYGKFTKVTDRSATFEWAAFGCRYGLIGYKVLLNGDLYKTVNAPTPWRATDTLTDLVPNTTYTVEIIGLTGPGEESIITRSFTTQPPDESGWFSTPTPSPTPTPTPTPSTTQVPPPTICVDPVPGETAQAGLRNVTATTATFFWRRFGCLTYLAGYDVLVNGEVVKTVNAAWPYEILQSGSHELTGLVDGKSYTVEVKGRTYTGATETVSQFTFTWPAPTPKPSPGEVTPTPTAAPPTPTPTPNAPQTYPYATKGSLAFRGQNLVGSFTLRGTATLKYGGPLTPPIARGTLSAASGTADLTFGGVLPIRTTIGLAGGPFALAGPFQAAFLSTQQTIVVKKASIFGLVLTSGGTCKTTVPVDLSLTPVGAAGLNIGGRFTGQFAPGKFAGCGALDQYLSSSSSTSSLALQLTPAPAPAAP